MDLFDRMVDVDLLMVHMIFARQMKREEGIWNSFWLSFRVAQNFLWFKATIGCELKLSGNAFQIYNKLKSIISFLCLSELKIIIDMLASTYRLWSYKSIHYPKTSGRYFYRNQTFHLNDLSYRHFRFQENRSTSDSDEYWFDSLILVFYLLYASENFRCFCGRIKRLKFIKHMGNLILLIKIMMNWLLYENNNMDRQVFSYHALSNFMLLVKAGFKWWRTAHLVF